MSNGDVRFARIRGRIVPIKGKGSAPKGSGISKRYGAKREVTKPKQIGIFKGAAAGAALGAGLTIQKVTKSTRTLGSMDLTGPHTGKFMKEVGPGSVSKITKSFRLGPGAKRLAAAGALLGAAAGSIKFFKKGKGESDKQLGRRASGYKAPKKTGV